MKLFIVILALAAMAYAVPVDNQEAEVQSVKLIPVENIEAVQSNQNTDVLAVEENSDDTSVTRDKRGLLLGKKLLLAKAGLLGLGAIGLKKKLILGAGVGAAAGGIGLLALKGGFGGGQGGYGGGGYGGGYGGGGYGGGGYGGGGYQGGYVQSYPVSYSSGGYGGHSGGGGYSSGGYGGGYSGGYGGGYGGGGYGGGYSQPQVHYHTVVIKKVVDNGGGYGGGYGGGGYGGGGYGGGGYGGGGSSYGGGYDGGYSGGYSGGVSSGYSSGGYSAPVSSGGWGQESW